MNATTERELASPYDAERPKPFAPLWAVELRGELSDQSVELHRSIKRDVTDDETRDDLRELAEKIDEVVERLESRFDWSKE